MKQEILLTNNFKLEEFAVSKDYPELAMDICFSDVEIERIRFFCASVLEPLRVFVKRPVKITSGKRTPDLNRAVGGSLYSHHLFSGTTGACDIVINGVEPSTIATWIINNVHTRYVIVYSNFLHISFPCGDEISFNQIKHG